MKTKFLLLLILPTLLAGCATPVQHATASGKPEVTIRTNVKTARKEITSYMINRDYNLVNSDDMRLVFDKIISDGGMANFLYGSQYDMNPAARIAYTLIENGKSVRVIADMAIVTNPGSGLERRHDANRSQDSLMIQNELNAIKSDIEGRRK